MRNKLKTFIKVISLLLTVAMLFCQYTGILAQTTANDLYVEEVSSFTAKTKSEATEKCRKAGYIPVDGDLNEGNDGDAVVLGYKTTTNKYEAITNLSVLEMNSGYIMTDYASVLEKETEQASRITSPFMASLDEFSGNLEKNSPAAKTAKEILNVLYIPEFGNIGLGDYLASEDCSEDYLKKLICQANSGVIMTVFNTMASGVADCGDENWIQRLVKSEVHGKIAAGEYDVALDREFESRARDLRSSLKSFSDIYLKASAFASKYGYDALLDEEDTAEDYEIPEGAREKIDECEIVEDKDKFPLYLLAYELLNTYTFEDGRGVGDYIVSLGNASYTCLDDLRKIYPLADALTCGQFGVMRIVGIPQMVVSVANEEGNLTEARKYIDTLKEDIRAFNKDGSEKLSVWVGVDRIPYTSEIALTVNAQTRATIAANEFSELTKESMTDKNLNYLLSTLGIVSTMADCVVMAATITYTVVQMYQLGFLAWVATPTVGMFAACQNAAFAAGTGVLATTLGYLGIALTVVTWAIMGIMLVTVVYMLIDWIIDECSPEEDAIEYTADDIPVYVYDRQNDTYIRYECVRDQNGAPLDLNAGEGKRFSALYTTKQLSAGDPIKVNPYGETLCVVKGNSAAPAGFTSVRYFGPGAAANLNGYANNGNAPAVYLSHFSGTPVEINTGEDSAAEGGSDETTPTPAADKTEYISALYVSVRQTEAAAKTELTKMGYTYIDKNLTAHYSGKGGLYTYLGYKTTTAASIAVTDIRVVPQGIGAGDSMMLGSATYIKAGEDIPGNIPSIYYCTSRDAGTPIYPDLQIVNDRSKASEGFEPVNLFCGGEAYNINATGDSDSYPGSLSYSSWNGASCVYIYFHPSVTYTSGTEYIGGLAFFTGKNTPLNDGNEIRQYAKENGFTTFENDFASGSSYVFSIASHLGKGKTYSDKTVSDLVTYLGYSTTYNPYRAVYSVRSYTALSDKVDSLNEMLVSGRVTVETPDAEAGTQTYSKAYAACNVFYQYCGQISKDKNKMTGFYRGILTSNAWNGINDTSRVNILPEISEYPLQDAEEFESYAWKSSPQRLKNLYVCGKIPGLSPLTPDDIRLVTSLDSEQEFNDAGLYSVRDAKAPNSTKAHNIGLYSSNPLYLFVRDEKPHEKKYVSAITVASWNFDATIGSDKAFKKLDEDQQEELAEKYNGMKDDMCITNALQSCTDEVILKNLAVSYGDSIQSSFGNMPKEAAYIGVTRTDNRLEAICSIIKFKPANKADAKLFIKVDGAEYTRAGSEPIHDKNGDYYIYYTTAIGCAPNEPITSIDFSDVPLVRDCATALTATESDITQRVHGGEIVREGRVGELKGYTNETNYIHSKFETTKTYICDIFVGSGNTPEEAMIDLMEMGCNSFLNINMNKGADGKYVYVGYDRYYDKNTSAKSAVRDIICTVGHAAKPNITVDGVTYKRACDRYLYKGDKTHGISLNEGTGGLSIYLYYSSASSGSAKSPIMNIAAGEKDLIPENAEEMVWENIMTTSGRRCDFNNGVFASDDEYTRDIRIYMFAHRLDNSVKDGSSIASGVTSGVMKYGKLVLK